MKKKYFSLLTVFLVCFLLGSQSYAAAYITWGTNKLSSGVGNYGKNTRYYWVSPGLGSAHKSVVDNAMYKWVNSNGTGAYTPISFRGTSTQSSSTIDFEPGAWSYGVLGRTYMKNGANTVNPMYSSWYWAKIEFTSNFSASNLTIRNTTAAHEIGHAMGLNHNDTISNTVMRTQYTSSMPSGPSINDFSGINYLY